MNDPSFLITAEDLTQLEAILALLDQFRSNVYEKQIPDEFLERDPITRPDELSHF